MAHQSDLRLAARLQPNELLQFLENKLNLQWNQQGYWLVGSALLISASTANQRLQALTEEEFSFRPTTNISFRLQPDDDDHIEQGEALLFEAIKIILQHEQGDAVLLFNSETLLFQRTHGHLSLNPTWSEWHQPAYQPLLSLPHSSDSPIVSSVNR